MNKTPPLSAYGASHLVICAMEILFGEIDR